MNSLIAYIDDSRANLDCLETIFKNEFLLETFEDPGEFLLRFSQTSYSSIIVDLHMPGISGISLYEKILEHPNYNACPVLFISSDDSDIAKIKSFELGAVDFLTRDIPPAEMIARVKSKINFYQNHRHIIEFDAMKVNLTLMKTFLNGAEIPLTFIELKILCLVIRNYPGIVLKNEIAEQVWKVGKSVDATVYTHLSNLNAKLKEWDHVVNSIKGKGIQLIKKTSTL